MQAGVAAAAFGIVALGELPDKTFFAAVFMAARRNALAVWAGAATALVAQAAIAVAAGRLLELAPHRVTDGLVAAGFLAGGVLLLAIREKTEEDRGARIAQSSQRWTRVALAAAAVVFVAEWGDVTQVAMVGLTARYHDPVGVFAGSSVALVATSGLGALAGKTLARRVPMALLRRIGGVVLLALAALATVATVRG